MRTQEKMALFRSWGEKGENEKKKVWERRDNDATWHYCLVLLRGCDSAKGASDEDGGRDGWDGRKWGRVGGSCPTEGELRCFKFGKMGQTTPRGGGRSKVGIIT